PAAWIAAAASAVVEVLPLVPVTPTVHMSSAQGAAAGIGRGSVTALAWHRSGVPRGPAGRPGRGPVARGVALAGRRRLARAGRPARAGRLRREPGERRRQGEELLGVDVHAAPREAGAPPLPPGPTVCERHAAVKAGAKARRASGP